VAHAWCGWEDDAAPNGAQFTYGHCTNDSNGPSPLQAHPLNSDGSAWGVQFKQTIDDRMPLAWQKQEAVVCVVHDLYALRQVPPSHPFALAHLGAFWGMVAATPSGGTWWDQSFRIVERRLRGLVMASARTASQTTEVLP